MKNCIVLCLFLLCTLQPSFARLGESLAQCTARYGNVIRETPGAVANTITYNFEKNGVTISAVINNGVCVHIVYTKKEGSAFSKLEIETLLDCNAGIYTWTPRESRDTYTYIRTDNNAIAESPEDLKELKVSDLAFKEKLAKATRMKESGLEGF